MAKAQTSTINQWRAPLHLWTAISMAVLLVVATGLITWRGYRGAEDALVSASIESIGHVRGALTEKIRRILELAEAQLSQLAYSDLSKADSLDQRLQALPAMAETLKDNDLVDALYAGYPNGEFVLFRPLRTDQDRERFKAPATAAILVQSITLKPDGGKAGEYRFYDAGLSELEERLDPNYKYDPREREWYKVAATASGPILTDPYVFFTTHAPGRTMARLSADGMAIVGLDVRLGTLAGELHRLTITPSTEMAIVDSDHRVIAYSDLGKSVIPTGAETFRLAQLDELGVPPLQRASALVGAGKVRFRAIVDGRAWQLIAAKIELHDVQPLHLVLAVPDDEFFAGARAIVWHQFKLAAIVLILSVAAVWWVTQRLVKSLRRLVKETTAISRFDFRQDQSIETRISEVSELEGALDSLKRTIRQFLEIGNALTAEREFRPLLERVLREIIGLVKSDGGAVFLLDESGRNLLPSMVRWRSEEVGDEGVGLAPIAMDKPGLFAELVAALQSKQIVTVERRLEDGELEALGLRRFVDDGNFERVSVVIVPLLNRNNAPLGALTLIKGMRADSRRWKVGDRLADLIRAVSGSASVAIENKQLLDAQKRLMDSLIQLVAGAIDAKSPYTGGHCTRVPALTQMLAEAACEQHDGPFKDFELSEEEWEAVHIASWLHDCGKVTTPEFVVDKATKLETIYDRIHEIRMRFEVLKRDAEIAYWRALAEGGNADELQAKLDAERKALDEDFAFIAVSNEGGEFMAPERIERVKRIATRQWRRTLSDRVGVSNEEKARKDRMPEPPLPVMEPLLADRDDHILVHETRDVISGDNQWGFKLTIPKHKYNRGEVHNLCIQRGTLTEEERYRINDHIVQTIIMLESLPFPRHLKKVPELAGGHHEKMDGTGYPKGLTRDQMSPVARMMAVADVFEALTAADRPYKKAKKLSEAIKIMGFMKKDRHLDPEILDLFLSTGVWRRYAERFLAPEQMDEPDIDAVLKTQPATKGLAA
jgi:HD-GYP domain-containing protein (c-di-GMP phosphodiesterase class II)